MSAPEQCPKCGSGLWWPIRDGHANYKCNSFMTDEGGFGQDVTCAKLAEITGPLLEQRDRARGLLMEAAQWIEKNAIGEAIMNGECDENCHQSLRLRAKLRKEAQG